MWIKISIFLLTFANALSLESWPLETCHPKVGCFNSFQGWPILDPRNPPRPPEELKNTILFFNREHKWRGINTTIYPTIEKELPVKRKKKTYVLIPGWLDTEISDWVIVLKNLLLKQGDYNILCLGAFTEMSAFYIQAVSDFQVVGRLIVVALKELGINPDNTELVCHSVACEAAASASTFVQTVFKKKFRKLTLLDASRYDIPPRSLRVNRFEGKFVIAFHSADGPATGFGILRPYGDIDIYVNNAIKQPACYVPLNWDMNHRLKFNQCSHNYLPDWYTYILEGSGCPAIARKLTPLTYLEAHINSWTSAVFAKFLQTNPNCTQIQCIAIDSDLEDSGVTGSFVYITDKEKHPVCMEGP